MLEIWQILNVEPALESTAVSGRTFVKVLNPITASRILISPHDLDLLKLVGLGFYVCRASFDGRNTMRMQKGSSIRCSTSACALPMINSERLDRDWYFFWTLPTFLRFPPLSSSFSSLLLLSFDCHLDTGYSTVF